MGSSRDHLENKIFNLESENKELKELVYKLLKQRHNKKSLQKIKKRV